jgi:hypothetical protein
LANTKKEITEENPTPNNNNEVLDVPIEPLPVEAAPTSKKSRVRPKHWWKEALKGIGNGPDINDKVRIGEHVENMSDPNPVIRAAAIEFTGLIAEKEGAELVVLCGAIDQLKQCLYDEHPAVVRMATLTIAAIARSGGTDVLLDSGIGDILRKIILSPHHKRFEKDGAAMALGWIFMSSQVDTPESA